MKSILKTIIAAAYVTAALHAQSSMACAMCAGKADGPLAEGMNAGIFVLLGVIGCVLATFGAFFIYLAKKAAAVSATEQTPEFAATPQRT